jgi:hypothetical protein
VCCHISLLEFYRIFRELLPEPLGIIIKAMM